MKIFRIYPQVLADQRGTALVLVLTMLAVLLILCTFALTNSTVEVKIAGNYRAFNESLSAAERGVQIGLNNLRDDLNLNSFDNLVSINRSGLRVEEIDEEPINRAIALGDGPPPVGSGNDATTASSFQARYYVLEVHGEFPQGMENASHTELEMQVSRIVAR
ncbi:pilus assembly PilX family protein [Geoalkalibacter sp.]|uniref:pilus assembly PilX family protein n=1 Tax=Geoalkalibacter sp. TaxID=3041440 RepID=UPI00272EA5E5|nr:PilX N-terminal domain-containing pilus assembly protein [Geoalkalibacter sp.]